MWDQLTGQPRDFLVKNFQESQCRCQAPQNSELAERKAAPIHNHLSRPTDDRFSAATCVASGWPFRELSEVCFCRGEQLLVLRVPGIGISPSRDVAEQLTETPIGRALAACTSQLIRVALLISFQAGITTSKSTSLPSR